MLSLIEQHDEWLKDCGWYDIITAMLDENWTGADDGNDWYMYNSNRLLRQLITSIQLVLSRSKPAWQCWPTATSRYHSMAKPPH